MQSTVMTATVRGVEAIPVEVQADVSPGIPGFAIVGLPDTAVQEARERVRSAIRAAGLDFPNARVTINLAPAPLRKHGTGFDLPIALALLAATGQIPVDAVTGCTAVGELALDGSVRPVVGILAHAHAAARDGLDLMAGSAVVDAAAAVGGVTCRLVDHLAAFRNGGPVLSVPVLHALSYPPSIGDFADVAGQSVAKRALEIAAAGGHNLLFVGPPGSGKTMLARRLCSILPPLSDGERVATALVHSVAGLNERTVLMGVRPFRMPHHSVSIAGLIGGGSPVRPGEISLAHNGVLFLDELPEFGPATLQALRQPLEDGVVSVVRVDGCVTYPACVSMVAAMNPCPCGYLGDPAHECHCTPAMIDRYASRIGGPLLDRIDMRVRVDRVEPSHLLDSLGTGETSAAIAQRVRDAREFAARNRSTGCGKEVTSIVTSRLSTAGRSALEDVAGTMHLSGRGVTRTLRVARTIADLALSDQVCRDHVMEAVSYRLGDAL